MAGLVPAIHASGDKLDGSALFSTSAPIKDRRGLKRVGGRDKPGHDGWGMGARVSAPSSLMVSQ